MLPAARYRAFHQWSSDSSIILSFVVHLVIFFATVDLFILLKGPNVRESSFSFIYGIQLTCTVSSSPRTPDICFAPRSETSYRSLKSKRKPCWRESWQQTHNRSWCSLLLDSTELKYNPVAETSQAVVESVVKNNLVVIPKRRRCMKSRMIWIHNAQLAYKVQSPR